MYAVEPWMLAGRQAAEESRMIDTCRITKPGAGEPDIDPVTLQYVDPAPTVVYEGRCRIPRRTSSAARAAAAEESWTVGEYPLDLPVDASADVAPGQTVTYLSAEDPALVGMVFGITEPILQSQATARRFRMKTAVGGGS